LFTSVFYGKQSVATMSHTTQQQQHQCRQNGQPASISPSNSNRMPEDQDTSSASDLDDWKQRAPYQIHTPNDDFHTIWKGSCHCGKVRYQLSREKPLAAKYCHCTTCQRLHGAPFQWAAIFHKTDINFTNGHHDLAWYDPSECTIRHKLPCKVSCAFCRTPIMDEGRNMILLFPNLIEGIAANSSTNSGNDDGKKARDVFRPDCHMFYSRRVVDIRDGLTKWDGLNDSSNRLDEDGNIISPPISSSSTSEGTDP
jgi:hypothetical protein